MSVTYNADKQNIYIDFQHGMVLGGVEVWASRMMKKLKKRGYNPIAITGTDQIKVDGSCTILTNFPLSNLIKACSIKKNNSQNIRHIVVLHNDEPLYYDKYTEMQEQIDICLVISSDMRGKLENHGFPSDKIRLLKWDLAINNRFDRSYSKLNCKLRIGYAGRLVLKQKRIDRLIDLADLLHYSGCSFRFEIAGEGIDYTVIRQSVTNRGLENVVLFPGKLSESEMSDFWQRQDIMISCSDYEGHSISQVEAMANGAVPIVTDVSGARDDIEDGVNGFVVPIGDIEAMKDRILQLDADRELLEKMGRSAHRIIWEREQEPNIMDELFPVLSTPERVSDESEVDNEKDRVISIILPSYNVASYIHHCIDSVLDQTTDDIEILCIDAGSTDGTLEILVEYESRDDRIRLIHSDIKSYGYQMNLGIREARGEYIGVVETDDYVEPSMFEALYRAARKYDADVVKALPRYLFELNNGEILKTPVDYIPAGHNTGIPFSAKDDPSVYLWDGNIWNGLYKRSFLLDNGISFQETPGAAFQDIGFAAQVLNKADSIIYLRTHLYNYRIFRQGASIMSTECLHNVRFEYEKIIDRVDIVESGLTYLYQRMLQSFFLELEKVSYAVDFDKLRIPCSEDIDWFKNRILSILKKDKSIIDRLDARNKENLRLFIGDQDAWFSRQKTRMELVTGWYENLRELISEGELVIFGAGRYGMDLLMFLAKNGIAPVAFADNDNSMEGRSIYGIQVLTTDEAVAWHRDALFLIANKKCPYYIRNQLVRKGIDEDRIMIFDGSDPELLEGIRRMNVPVKT